MPTSTNSHRIALTAPQLAALDAFVLDRIAAGVVRPQFLLEALRDKKFLGLPKRTDPDRYVDQAIKRLKQGGKIRRRGKGWSAGWEPTT